MDFDFSPVWAGWSALAAVCLFLALAAYEGAVSVAALFFAVVGMVYDRTHTREISSLGGLARKMPLAAVAFIVGGLVSMGMPGFSGFVAEFPIFLGLWQTQPLVAVAAALAIVVTAAYILVIIRRVFFGPIPEEYDRTVTGISWKDKTALLFLMLFLVGVGVYPNFIAPLVQTGVQPILKILGMG